MKQVALTLSTPQHMEETMAPGAKILRGFAQASAAALLAAVQDITRLSPFRQQRTPGGRIIKVAMTCCGDLGWVSDARGYRYATVDPVGGKAWPALPVAFVALAQEAAARAGFANYRPSTCLVNRYLPGDSLALHQDLDEHDDVAPIVSVSLGLDAVFLFGGFLRHAPTQRYLLQHGDVVVWGGPSRLRFHGVQAVQDGYHPRVGAQRINLTFRQVAA